MSHTSIPFFIEESLRRGETQLTDAGAVVCLTGKYTGRCAKDKYFVEDEQTKSLIEWNKGNQRMTREQYQKLRARVIEVLERSPSYTQELAVGADPEYAFPLIVKTELANQALFAKTMFRERGASNPRMTREKPFTVLAAPSACAVPKEDGTHSEVFVALDLSNREIIIGGTRYCGEIKKSVFTAMNYMLPQQGILTMHAAANLDAKGNAAIFFGLSGTGKTTLSADARRRLIGDDEHGWSDRGIFNLEGGCYAKAIRLSAKSEPEIWGACHSFGTLLENVEMDANTRSVDFNSERFTENTRAAYPLTVIPNHEPTGCGGQPSAVIMLTCDAFGVLPPVAKLNVEQAMYYFLSGYTAKVAGTEAGITEPVSTFSACFGEPFMALSPLAYAKLLAERLKKHNVPCYLINTGWWKGPYGTGERMPIALSRALVQAAVTGELATAEFKRDANFGFLVPTELKGISKDQLDVAGSWSDRNAYNEQAKKLAQMFHENFDKRFTSKVDAALKNAGPYSS